MENTNAFCRNLILDSRVFKWGMCVESESFKTENHPRQRVDNLFSQPAGKQLNLRNSFRLLLYF